MIAVKNPAILPLFILSVLWFFSRACWDQDFDIDAGLHDYCRNYYAAEADEIEEVFAVIFSELHPEPYLAISDGSISGRVADIQLTASSILNRLDQIMDENSDPVIGERILRLRTYVEFFQLLTAAFSRREREDLENLLKYIEGHPRQDMVLMYPAYFHWRNREIFHQ